MHLHITENINQNIIESHVLFFKTSKHQNKIYGFVLQVSTTFPTLPKTMSELFFPEPPLWVGPKFPHHDSKPKEFQIQINKVP